MLSLARPALNDFDIETAVFLGGDGPFGTIGVLFGCFGGKIDGPGLPGGLIIYQGYLFGTRPPTN